MSELSAAAADALGVPESIVQRSAAARAEETGMTVDEVLAAWAGGGEIPAGAAPPPTPEAAETERPPEEEAPAAPAPDEAVSAPPAADRTSVANQAADRTSVANQAADRTSVANQAAGPPAERGDTGRPPVLIGEADSPMAFLVGVVALFVAIFLVGLVGPALPIDNPGARSSDLPYSEAGLRGQHIYQSVGCASCHTQMVRPVVADVGLGAVTLNDSNQVLGTRRFGPDLSNVGARVSGSQIEGVINGLGGHPSLSLSPEDLDDLVTYLLESQTMEAAPEAPPADEEPADS